MLSQKVVLELDLFKNYGFLSPFRYKVYLSEWHTQLFLIVSVPVELDLSPLLFTPKAILSNEAKVCDYVFQM